MSATAGKFAQGRHHVGAGGRIAEAAEDGEWRMESGPDSSPTECLSCTGTSCPRGRLSRRVRRGISVEAIRGRKKSFAMNFDVEEDLVIKRKSSAGGVLVCNVSAEKEELRIYDLAITQNSCKHAQLGLVWVLIR